MDDEITINSDVNQFSTGDNAPGERLIHIAEVVDTV